MINKPEWLVPGAFVRVIGAGAARIVDICQSDTHIMVGLESAKCAARFQAIEWLDYSLDPGQWSTATVDEVLEEYNHELVLAERAIQQAYNRRSAVHAHIERMLISLSD